MTAKETWLWIKGGEEGVDVKQTETEACPHISDSPAFLGSLAP